MPPISGQHVLILGGSSGIGFSVAKLSLSENVRVAIASSDQTRVAAAIDRLSSTFPEAQNRPRGYTIDLNSREVEAELEELLNDVTSQGTEPLDHIILTAGKPDVQPFAKIDLAYLAQNARLPFFVPILLAKSAPRYLRAGFTSSIIFTTGQVAEKPVPGYSVYAAYAGGIHALARSLAIDLAPRRVNVVAPGATETELWGEYKEMLRERAMSSLLGKPASPDEVAEAYVYLMKNTDSTGAIVSSNAGATLK